MKKILLSLTASSLLLFGAYSDEGTDYSNAKVHKFTEESSLELLETVNMILGFMEQSKATEFLNEGNYTALVQDNTQEKESSNDGKSGTTQKLIPMTLNVTGRTSPTEPMYVKLWMDMEDGFEGQAMRVVGSIEVTKGVSDIYPLGKFLFNFSGYPLDVNTSSIIGSNPMMNGVLQVDKGAYNGQVEVQFKQDIDSNVDGAVDFPEELSMNIQMTDVDTNVSDEFPAGHFEYEKQGRGVAYAKGMSWDDCTQENCTPQMKEYEITFSNEGYKVRPASESGTSTTGEKTVDKSSKNYTVYRYGVFSESNGSKLENFSGFPFRTDGNKFGYASYYGIWSETPLEAGTGVTQEGTSNNYTIVKSPGKLHKHTKTGVTLSKIAGTKLYLDNYVITWNGSDFIVLGTQGDMGEIDTSTSLLNKSVFSEDYNNTAGGVQEWTKAWSEALNAPIAIKSTYANDTNVTYHQQEVVSGVDLNLTSFSFQRINTDNPSVQSPVLELDENDSNFTIGRSYHFDGGSMMLIDLNASDANVTIDFSATNLQGTPYEYGIRMEPMVTNELAGDYNQTNFWTASDADVYYSWEIGQEEWNQFTGLKDVNGTIVKFDPPIIFGYEHTQANDMNDDASNEGFYSLEYDGSNLNVPWEFDATNNNWNPKINIDFNTTVTHESTNYVIKPLDIRVNLGDDTEGVTNSLVYDDSRNGYAGPEHNATIIELIKDSKPDAAVSVIKGECVNSDCSIVTIPAT